MIKSMTGYGRGIAGEYIIEVKSVNHRFLEAPLKGLRVEPELKELIRKRIKSAFSRGYFDVIVSRGSESSIADELTLDRGVVEKIAAFADELSGTYRIQGAVTVDTMLNFRGVIVSKESGKNPEEISAEINAALEQALVAMNKMKEAEGEFLFKDLSDRLKTVGLQVDDIEKEMPVVLENYTKRFRCRIHDLLGNIEVDETRLAGEVAILADKSDISEEVTRLKSHISQFRMAFEHAPPVGKRLDFILQEMNRETNTIGSKAIDTSLTDKVVTIKTELERMKEQVQNVE